VAWFKRPDIDVRKPLPWTIEGLRKEAKAISNYADSGDAAKAQERLHRAMAGSIFHASEWKPDDEAPLLTGLRPGFNLSEWFTLKDAQNLPEYKVQLAQVGMSFNALEPDPRGASAIASMSKAGAAGSSDREYRPGGGAIVPARATDQDKRRVGATPLVILSLAEAEAVRRAIHAGDHGTGGGVMHGVQLWNVSLGTVIDAAGSGTGHEVSKAPAWDVRLAMGRFSNCDVYIPEESAKAALEPLGPVPTKTRRDFFDRLARRRRGGAASWAGTPMAQVLTVKDLTQLAHRDEQVQRVRDALTSKGWDPDRLFRELDEDKSGTLSVTEFRSLVGRLDLPLPESDVTDLLRAADRDMDGFVTVGEFRRAFAAVEG